MRGFGTGYRPDPGQCRTSFHHLAGRMGATPLPASTSLIPLAPPVMHQGSGSSGTSSCTGHATACGLHVALGLEWVPSPGEIYRNGRAIDRLPHPDGSFDPLVDEGAMPNQVFRAVNEFGIRPMVPLADRFSDADPATINREPTLGDLEAEALTVVVGDYGIYSTGQQRLDDIARAIAAGKPVTCAIAGGSAQFQDYAGGVLGALGAPLDHYVVLLAYETGSDGRRVYTIRNSWGVLWGESGNVRLAEAAVAELGDLVALDVRLTS